MRMLSSVETKQQRGRQEKMSNFFLFAFLAVCCCSVDIVPSATAFHPVVRLYNSRQGITRPYSAGEYRSTLTDRQLKAWTRLDAAAAAPEGGDSTASEPPAPAAAPPAAPIPMLNGKRIVPSEIMLTAVKGSETKIAAVYAVFNRSYKNQTPSNSEWPVVENVVEYIGVTQDLATALTRQYNAFLNETVAAVKALSFSYPEQNAMQEVANRWRAAAAEAAGVSDPSLFLTENSDSEDCDWERLAVLGVSYDDCDDDYDEWEYYDETDDYFDFDDWEMEDTADSMASVADGTKTESSTIISPFDSSTTATTKTTKEVVSSVIQTLGDAKIMDLTVETVDKVLDEVRPYLISDGGNVEVVEVDAEAGAVYLRLQGACGSCASSTVTMQMGIERVLKEQFGSRIKQVLQVEDEEANGGSKELTIQAVQDEVNRLLPAITAMGGVCRIVNVEATTGVVQINFQGASRVRQGLELAIRDLPFVNEVLFVE